MHKLESVQKWTFEIQTDHQVLARRSIQVFKEQEENNLSFSGFCLSYKIKVKVKVKLTR